MFNVVLSKSEKLVHLNLPMGAFYRWEGGNLIFHKEKTDVDQVSINISIDCERPLVIVNDEDRHLEIDKNEKTVYAPFLIRRGFDGGGISFLKDMIGVFDIRSMAIGAAYNDMFEGFNENIEYFYSEFGCKKVYVIYRALPEVLYNDEICSATVYLECAMFGVQLVKNKEKKSAKC